MAAITMPTTVADNISGITRPKLVHSRLMVEDAHGHFFGKSYGDAYWRMSLEFAEEGVSDDDIEYGNDLQFFLEQLNDDADNFFNLNLTPFLNKIPTYKSGTVPRIANYNPSTGVFVLTSRENLEIGQYVNAGTQLLQIDALPGSTQARFRPGIVISNNTSITPAASIRLGLAQRSRFQTATTLVSEGEIDRRTFVEFQEYR